MTALLTRIPSAVRASGTLAGARMYSYDGSGYDYAIGGLPFNGAATEQNPVVRQTAPSQKEQSDTSREPGEHSLAFWWLKAQSSFHGGAGQRYLGSADTDNDGISRYRFWESEGVDVFSEPGSVSLLPSTLRIPGTEGTTPVIAVGSNGILYTANGASISTHSLSPLTGRSEHPDSTMNVSTTTVSWGDVATVRSITASSAGRVFWATDEGVYRRDLNGTVTKIYTGVLSNQLLRFVKERLILAVWGAVYELDIAAAANTALPTPLFTTPSTYWNAIVESPAAILLAGESGNRSAVYKMNLDTSGPVPLLTPGVVVAEFPPGEFVRGMATYLGTVVGVQTTAGFRVGILDNSGDFQYGSLLFEHEWGQASPAVFGMGNSLYAGWTNPEGIAGLVRVDLSNTIGSGQSLRFPWAPDVRARAFINATWVYQAGVVTDAAYWDYDRKVLVVQGAGVFYQSNDREESGYLRTSRIRWDTTEPKLVRFARIRGDGSSGRISLDVGRDSDVNYFPVGSVDLARGGDSGDMYVHLSPGQFFSVRLTITGSASLQSYQLKGLPAQRRQRFLSIPLHCYDREVSANGQVMGVGGSGMQRLLALESLEQSGQVVALQWLNTWPDLQLTEYVTIEQVEFRQMSGPSSSKGWGGIVTVTLRTVD